MKCNHEVKMVKRAFATESFLTLSGECVTCGVLCIMVVSQDGDIWVSVGSAYYRDEAGFSDDEAEWSW